MKRALLAIGLALAVGIAIWFASGRPGTPPAADLAPTAHPRAGPIDVAASTGTPELHPDESFTTAVPDRTAVDVEAADLEPLSGAVEEVLPVAAQLEGWIVSRADIPLELVRPVLEIPDIGSGEVEDDFSEPCDSKVWPGPTRVGPDGRFAWRDLRAGKVTFLLTLHGEPDPLLLVPGIALRAGETTRDPRLQGIAIDGRVVLHRIEVVDEDGVPLPLAMAIRQPRRGSHCHPGYRASEQGEIVIASLSETIAVRVLAAGHRTVELVEVGPFTRVEMRRGYPVHVQMDRGWQDAHPWGLSLTPISAFVLHLQPRGAHREPYGENFGTSVDFVDPGDEPGNDLLSALQEGLTRELPGTGEAEFVLPRAGRYDVTLRFEARRDGEDLRSSLVLGIALNPVDVGDASEVQRFDLRPDERNLQIIRESLAEIR